MRYHWGHGVGHIYAFTPGLEQEDLQDSDGNIQRDVGCTSGAAQADDRPNDDSNEMSWSDDELQDGCVDCEAPGDDSDGDSYLVNTMYDSDQDELSEHYEF